MTNDGSEQKDAAAMRATEKLDEAVASIVDLVRDGVFPGMLGTFPEDVRSILTRLSPDQSAVRELVECEWKYDEEYECWDTSCDNAWCFNDGGPTENEARFCAYCGLPIKEVK